MDRDGILFAGIPFLLGVAVLALTHWWISIPFLGLALFMVFFFRDPERQIPEGNETIVSSADGKVTRVEKRGDKNFVSVFLSPFDVHINRAPIKGEVTKVELFQGLKKPATSDESSETNERNAVTIRNEDSDVVCTQIVGVLARRIVCRVKEGDIVAKGQRFGLIRFGSRTDLLMPSDFDVLVKPGDRVRGGESVIAKKSD